MSLDLIVCVVRIKLLCSIAKIHRLHKLRVDDEPLPLLVLLLGLVPQLLVRLLVIHREARVGGVHSVLGLSPQHLVGNTLLVAGHTLFDLSRLIKHRYITISENILTYLWDGHQSAPNIADTSVESDFKHSFLGQPRIRIIWKNF